MDVWFNVAQSRRLMRFAEAALRVRASVSRSFAAVRVSARPLAPPLNSPLFSFCRSLQRTLASCAASFHHPVAECDGEIT